MHFARADRQAETFEDLLALDGDVKNSTFAEKFLEAFPDRFVEGFIAEQNIVSVAAGLAAQGLDVAGADLVVGTSAGALAGAQVTSGTPLAELYQAQCAPSEVAVTATSATGALVEASTTLPIRTEVD